MSIFGPTGYRKLVRFGDSNGFGIWPRTTKSVAGLVAAGVLRPEWNPAAYGMRQMS